MQDYKKEFIDFMVECGVLTFGDFVTKSGRKTPFFVNTGNYKTGHQLNKLGEFYAKAIKENFKEDFDVLFGPAYKGIPLTVAASMALDRLYNMEVSYCSNRKEVKDHGDKGIDRMEKGQGEVSALDELKEKFGFKPCAIVTMAEVVEYLYNKEINGTVLIDDKMKENIEAYYELYGAEKN